MLTVKATEIMKTLRAAKPWHIEFGLTWYARAYKQCQQISKTHKVPLVKVVGVLAALSPNNKWERNVMDTMNMCYAYVNKDSYSDVRVCTYNANKDKAISILEITKTNWDYTPNWVVKEVEAILSGRKTTAFFKCIYDHTSNIDTVCVDGHAKNIYTGERHALSSNGSNMTPRQYRVITDSYIKAAKLYNKRHGTTILPYQVQAITWVAHREKLGIK